MISDLAASIDRLARPFVEATTDPLALRILLERTGVDIDGAVDQLVDDVAAAIGLSAEVAVITSYTPTPDLDTNLDLIEAVAAVVGRVDELIGGDASIDTSQLPPPLDDPAQLGNVLRDTVDVVVARFLSDDMRALNTALLLAGIRERYEPGPINWSQIPALFDDPGAALADSYGWGGVLDLSRLDAAIAGLGDVLPLPLRRAPLRDALAASYWPDGTGPGVLEYILPVARFTGSPASGEFGFVLAPVPSSSGPPGPAGLLIAPVAAGTFDDTIALRPGWDLHLTAGADLTGAVGLALMPAPPADPDGVAGVTVVPTPGAGDLTMGVTLTGRPPEPGAWGFGGDGSPRLDLHGIEFGLAIGGATDAPEPSARVALRAPDGGPGLIIALADPEADGFMGWIIGDAVVEASLEIEVSPSGFRLVGGVGVDITIPVDKQFGPLYIASVGLGMSVEIDEDPALRAEATVTGNVRIGPLVLVADGLGVAAVVEAAPDGDGLLGRTDLRFELIPPTAFGASLDSEVVKGGGYVEITPPRYSGMLDLQVLAVGITVVGVVDAAGADAPPGTPSFSLYLSILTEFTPIPLAFGFTLNGVGGIVAFNRTMDTDALVDGLFAGDLDHILYPDDPIADAPQILASIDSFFPVQEGATTFGPVVRIGWGIPVTLVTIDVGVIISFPDLAIVLIGKVHVALPDEAFPLLELNAQVMGVVDFDGPTIMVVAAIDDSQVLGIQLTGEFAAYLDLGPNPYFMFSVGGTHPDWVPPAGLPSALHDLERLGASIVLSESVFIRVGGYFALTSNTVQFGGGLHFEASTKFLGTTYYAMGIFEVNVLIVFNPFRIKAGLRAGCDVRTDKRVLFGVLFTADFEGPDPWFASGGAEFKFFGINVNFPVEVGSRARAEVAPPVDVADALAEALTHPDAWVTLPATADGTADDVVGWLTFEGEAAAPTRPQDAIELRQTVVPLNVEIERYGSGVPAGADRFDVGAVELGGTATTATTVTDVFAPSLFFDMNDADRLSSPSFVHHDAGVSFGGGATVDAAESTVSIAHEQRIVGTVGASPKPQRVPLPELRLVGPPAGLLRREPIRVVGPTIEVIRT